LIKKTTTRDKFSSHPKDYYFKLGAVTQRDSWEPWIEFMLEATEKTSILTNVRINEILEQMDSTLEYAKGKIPVIAGTNEAAVKMAQALKERGYWALPIRPPTVPEGEARLRFSLTFDHDVETLKRLADDIAEIGI